MESAEIKVPGICQFRLCKLSDMELAKRVCNGLEKMYQTGNVPTRHVPARPDEDFDLLVGEMVIRLIKNHEKQNHETP